MGIGDALLCIFLPPLASGVRVRGCGMMLFVLLLTCLAWLPGIIAAFYFQMNKPKTDQPPQIVVINQQPPTPPLE